MTRLKGANQSTCHAVFLSDHYYQSIPCLNEMGASWMLSDKHYPIALNNFSMKDMKGVISSERLAIAFNDKTSTNEINCLLKSYLMTQMYKLSQILN